MKTLEDIKRIATEILELEKQATQGELIIVKAGTPELQPFTTVEQCAQYAYDTIMRRDSADMYIVVKGGEDYNPHDTLMVAMTGNGPTSLANAEFIATTRNSIVDICETFLELANNPLTTAK
jgi:hypothetical protein